MSDNCWSVARLDKLGELDLNTGISWRPGEGGCKVKVQFDQFAGQIPAISFNHQEQVTYTFALEEKNSIAYKPSKYNGQTLLNAITPRNEINITGNHEENDIPVQDIDNMPPLFCSGEDSANCPAESYHRSAYNQY